MDYLGEKQVLLRFAGSEIRFGGGGQDQFNRLILEAAKTRNLTSVPNEPGQACQFYQGVLDEQQDISHLVQKSHLSGLHLVALPGFLVSKTLAELTLSFYEISNLTLLTELQYTEQEAIVDHDILRIIGHKFKVKPECKQFPDYRILNVSFDREIHGSDQSLIPLAEALHVFEERIHKINETQQQAYERYQALVTKFSNPKNSTS